jgi:hypothetical protein
MAFASIAIYVSKTGLIDRHIYDVEPAKLPLFALVSEVGDSLPRCRADPMI